MKKFFSFVAALCIAVAASASVVWTESLDKNGTYIDKSGEQIWGTYWPYVNQWWEAGNMVNEYTSVTSYSCSIRGKKLNEDSQNTIGFYFGANKTADKCYFNLVNDKAPIYTAVEGDTKYSVHTAQCISPIGPMKSRATPSTRTRTTGITRICPPA